MLDYSHGIGISSISDWNYEELSLISSHVNERKKIFAIHASENKRENIQKILDLKPRFVVHLCSATDEDITDVAKEKIGVVVCPRANLFFGLQPPIDMLLKKKIPVMLGTDNAMIVKPDIFKEVDFLIKNYDINQNTVLKMISDTPTKIFEEILKKHAYS